jgi:hypothetical protein
MDFINEDIENYAHAHTGNEGELLAQLEKETYETLEIPQMTTGRIEGRFLKMLAQLVGAKRILEIGTFGGYASLSMAEALPDDGELFTCDVDPVCQTVFCQSQTRKENHLVGRPRSRIFENFFRATRYGFYRCRQGKLSELL